MKYHVHKMNMGFDTTKWQSQYVNNSLHFPPKFARIFGRGRYLFREADPLVNGNFFFFPGLTTLRCLTECFSFLLLLFQKLKYEKTALCAVNRSCHILFVVIVFLSVVLKNRQNVLITVMTFAIKKKITMRERNREFPEMVFVC